MINRIRSQLHKFVPPELRSGPKSQVAQAESFVFIGIVTSCILLAFSVGYFVRSEMWVAYINMIALSVVTPAWLFFDRIKSIKVVGNMLMLGVFISLIVGSWFAGGINAPGILWFSVAQLGGVFILRGRMVYMWTLLFSLAAIVLVLVPSLGYQLPILINQNESDVIKLISAIGTGLVTLALARVYYEEKKLNLKEMESRRFEAEKALKQFKEADSKLFDKLMENASLARVLSHDVSNPLMVISYMIKLMEKKDDGRHKEAIERIKKSLQNATDIITQVRMLQAMNSGKMQLDLAPVPLADVIEDSLLTFRERLEEKKLKIVIRSDLPKDQIVHVLAERVSLTQSVVNNLISNAIKFSEIGGSIELLTSMSDGKAVLSVKDHGVGMPADLMKKIFRADQATTRNGTSGEKGTGFGMPLVKSYCDQYGAEIKVFSQTKEQSPTDHGTQFDIEFKLAG